LFGSLAEVARRTSGTLPGCSWPHPYAAPDVAAELSLFVVHTYPAHDDAPSWGSADLAQAMGEENEHGGSPHGLAVSPDGFIGGPNDGAEAPMGVGGERLLARYAAGDTE
jgi:hypothetical protein